MQALAIGIVLFVFVWIVNVAPMFGLVLFCIFGLPLVITGAFAVDPRLGVAVGIFVLGVSVYFLPWLVIPAVALGIIVFAGVAA